MGSPLGLKFWGTRGLISAPGSENAIYGGNTTCIQILHKDKLILVDTGFGASVYGEELIKRILVGKEKLEIHIFYTHFHWDHVQGLPFFHPIYFKTATLNIYSPVEPAKVKTNLDILFDGSYSPFAGIDSMESQINFHQISDSIEIDGLKVERNPVDHGDASSESNPIAYAYRFTNEENENITIVTDHEARDSAINDSVVKFCENTDVLVHDSQWTEEEYKEKVGWGHSTAEQALRNAEKAKSGVCLLTHHDPSHTDKDLQKSQRTLTKDERFKAVKFEYAREDVAYEVTKTVKNKAG